MSIFEDCSIISIKLLDISFYMTVILSSPAKNDPFMTSFHFIMVIRWKYNFTSSFTWIRERSLNIPLASFSFLRGLSFPWSIWRAVLPNFACIGTGKFMLKLIIDNYAWFSDYSASPQEESDKKKTIGSSSGVASSLKISYLLSTIDENVSQGFSKREPF